LGNWNIIWKRGATTMRALTIVFAKHVVLTEKNTKNRVPFVITYLALSNLSNIARKHWTTIQNIHNSATSSWRNMKS
jgi:hypothetical protein